MHSMLPMVAVADKEDFVFSLAPLLVWVVFMVKPLGPAVLVLAVMLAIRELLRHLAPEGLAAPEVILLRPVIPVVLVAQEIL